MLESKVKISYENYCPHCGLKITANDKFLGCQQCSEIICSQCKIEDEMYGDICERCDEYFNDEIEIEIENGDDDIDE